MLLLLKFNYINNVNLVCRNIEKLIGAQLKYTVL